jgi:hypothetical protein
MPKTKSARKTRVKKASQGLASLNPLILAAIGGEGVPDRMATGQAPLALDTTPTPTVGRMESAPMPGPAANVDPAQFAAIIAAMKKKQLAQGAAAAGMGIAPLGGLMGGMPSFGQREPVHYPTPGLTAAMKNKILDQAEINASLYNP